MARARGHDRPHHRRGLAVLRCSWSRTSSTSARASTGRIRARCSSCPCSAPSVSCRAASSSRSARARSRAGDVRALRALAGRHRGAGRDLPRGHRAGVVRPDLSRSGLTIGTNLFGTTFYPLVGLHASHVIVGLVMLGLCCVFAWSGALQAGACRAGRDGVLVLALRRRGVDRGVHRRVRDRPMTPVRRRRNALEVPAPTAWPMVLRARRHAGRRRPRHPRLGERGRHRPGAGRGGGLVAASAARRARRARAAAPARRAGEADRAVDDRGGAAQARRGRASRAAARARSSRCRPASSAASSAVWRWRWWRWPMASSRRAASGIR